MSEVGLALPKTNRNKAKESEVIVIELLSSIDNLEIEKIIKIINYIYDSGEKTEGL